MISHTESILSILVGPEPYLPHIQRFLAKSLIIIAGGGVRVL